MFGLVPAFRATRTNLTASLKTGGRGSVGAGRALLDRGVVVAQLSFALLLVSAASLLVTTLRNVARVDGGFATPASRSSRSKHEGRRTRQGGIVPIHDEMLRRVRAIPGVGAPGWRRRSPIAGGRNITV